MFGKSKNIGVDFCTNVIIFAKKRLFCELLSVFTIFVIDYQYRMHLGKTQVYLRFCSQFSLYLPPLLVVNSENNAAQIY